ncbi:MAG: hypothetical protein JRJ64_12660 [Deltaproteobacteria bacterium]|jgi:hypothetical protein|nr:hypothetical protein [Deltaproteobacteria bacterium]
MWGERCRVILGDQVEVISDKDLIVVGGIARHVNEARELAGLKPLAEEL